MNKWSKNNIINNFSLENKQSLFLMKVFLNVKPIIISMIIFSGLCTVGNIFIHNVVLTFILWTLTFLLNLVIIFCCFVVKIFETLDVFKILKVYKGQNKRVYEGYFEKIQHVKLRRLGIIGIVISFIMFGMTMFTFPNFPYASTPEIIGLFVTWISIGYTWKSFFTLANYRVIINEVKQVERSQMVQCENCGEYIGRNQQECPNCKGIKFNICASCGRKFNKRLKKCPDCKTEVKNTD